MATLESNKKRIVKAMKAAGIYSSELTVQIEALAAQLTAMQIAAAEIGGMTSVCVMNESGHGTTSVVHPAFKVLRDTTDQITRMNKQLNITVADLGGKPEARIPLDDLIDAVNNTE